MSFFSEHQLSLKLMSQMFHMLHKSYNIPQYSLLSFIANKPTLHIPQLMYLESCYPSTITDCHSLTGSITVEQWGFEVVSQSS